MAAVAGLRSVLLPNPSNSSKLNGHFVPAVSDRRPLNTTTNTNSINATYTDDKPSFIWTVGLINSKQRYLTAETFGDKVNVTGTTLKKKQIWTLVPVGQAYNVVALCSHMGKYLSLDQYGNVTCQAEDVSEEQIFTIVEANDGTGRWAFRNDKYQYYLTGEGEKLSGVNKARLEMDYWAVHLSSHPMCCLRSSGRKRYGRMVGDELVCDQDVAWGRDALLSLEFTPDWRYSIRTYSGLYLNRNGQLSEDSISQEARFTLVFYGGQVAFRDTSGKFLSPFGNEASLRCKSGNITKSELFILEHAQPQCALLAHNSRLVSMRQGVDLSANQDVMTENEIFQLEGDATNNSWHIRTRQNRYWTIGASNGIQANADPGGPNWEGTGFELVYPSNGGGKVALRSLKNGRFVMVRPTGHLFAQADSADNAEHFQLLLLNRPVLALRCLHGFVGLKNPISSGKLECNKASFECIEMENGPEGTVYLSGSNKKYLDVGDDKTINADSVEPKAFYLHLKNNGKLLLKAPNGYFLVGEQNGLFKASGKEETATHWSY